jgi:hypothetical protein
MLGRHAHRSRSRSSALVDQWVASGECFSRVQPLRARPWNPRDTTPKASHSQRERSAQKQRDKVGQVSRAGPGPEHLEPVALTKTVI